MDKLRARERKNGYVESEREKKMRVSGWQVHFNFK